MRRRGAYTAKARAAKAVAPDELPDPPETAEGCEDALRWVYAAIATGQVDPVRGREMVNAIKVLHGAMAKRDALGRRDVLTVMAEMGRVVERHVPDDATRQKIREGWLAIRMV
jgi:hypothetical protein